MQAWCISGFPFCHSHTTVHRSAEVIDADPDAERRRLLHQVVFQSNMAGIPENSELFYSLLEAKCQRMVWCRELVVEALSTLGDDSGFDQWERALITVRNHVHNRSGKSPCSVAFVALRTSIIHHTSHDFHWHAPDAIVLFFRWCHS